MNSMKVTGYKLQHTLRELHHRRDTAATQFDDGLHQFEGDDPKPTPTEVFDLYSKTEVQIAKLEVAQTRYNLAQTVLVLGEEMTLSEAVKRVGGAGRQEKMWRSLAAPKKDRYYSREELTRDAGQERARRTVSYQEASKRAQQAARYASALREAIQVANSCLLDVEGLTPALFE